MVQTGVPATVPSAGLDSSKSNNHTQQIKPTIPNQTEHLCPANHTNHAQPNQNNYTQQIK